MLEDLIDFAFTLLVTCISLVVTIIIMWTLIIFILYVQFLSGVLSLQYFYRYTENPG